MLFYIKGAHGVGHGIGKVLSDQLETAMAVCGLHYDHDFVYACASGISMDMHLQYPTNISYPCDVLNFPAACFKFKSPYYKTEEKPCSNLDTYHTIGCLFGKGYSIISQHNICMDYYPKNEADETEWIYYLACLEGNWNKQKLYTGPSNCDVLKNSPIYTRCIPFQSDAPEWDWNLLENYSID